MLTTALRLDRVLVLAWPPVRCACGRMVAFAVNRGGKTRCAECDAKEEKWTPPSSSLSS